jgi:hypothetical protein
MAAILRLFPAQYFGCDQMMDVGGPAATRDGWELLRRESVCWRDAT